MQKTLRNLERLKDNLKFSFKTNLTEGRCNSFSKRIMTQTSLNLTLIISQASRRTRLAVSLLEWSLIVCLARHMTNEMLMWFSRRAKSHSHECIRSLKSISKDQAILGSTLRSPPSSAILSTTWCSRTTLSGQPHACRYAWMMVTACERRSVSERKLNYRAFLIVGLLLPAIKTISELE